MNYSTLNRAKDLEKSIRFYKQEISDYENQLERAENSKTEKLDNYISIECFWSVFKRKIIDKSLAIIVLSDIINYYKAILECDEAEFKKL